MGFRPAANTGKLLLRAVDGELLVMGLAEHEARSACPFPQPDPARSIWGGGLGCNFAGQTNPRRRLLVLGPLGEGGCFGVIFGFSEFRLTMSCSPTPIIRSTGVISSEVGGWCIHPPYRYTDACKHFTGAKQWSGP